jgi:release factor glutamine methyltransferase
MEYDPAQVYQPEADTYLMLRAARAEARTGDLVLEIGTGSGLIASELLQTGGLKVIATDINPHAAAASKRRGVEVIRTDCVSGLCSRFDLIIFNPPYLPTQPEERLDDWLEYALDGGVNGRDVIERFAADAGRILAPSGRILLLVSALTGIEEVKKCFFGLGFSSTEAAEETVEGEWLVVLRITRTLHGGVTGAGASHYDNAGQEDKPCNHQAFHKKQGNTSDEERRDMPCRKDRVQETIRSQQARVSSHCAGNNRHFFWENQYQPH